jgi:hypothetical protein
MHGERSLFPVRTSPLYRKHGRETSKASAKALRRSSALAENQARALAAVERWPRHTARELSNLQGDRDAGTIRKRLSELEFADLIQSGRKRRCTITGRIAVVWWVRK